MKLMTTVIGTVVRLHNVVFEIVCTQLQGNIMLQAACALWCSPRPLHDASFFGSRVSSHAMHMAAMQGA
jgi:hypothetical protein